VRRLLAFEVTHIVVVSTVAGHHGVISRHGLLGGSGSIPAHLAKSAARLARGSGRISAFAQRVVVFSLNLLWGPVGQAHEVCSLPSLGPRQVTPIWLAYRNR
jgi:hypothetical protein